MRKENEKKKNIKSFSPRDKNNIYLLYYTLKRLFYSTIKNTYIISLLKYISFTNKYKSTLLNSILSSEKKEININYFNILNRFKTLKDSSYLCMHEILRNTLNMMATCVINMLTNYSIGYIETPWSWLNLFFPKKQKH